MVRIAMKLEGQTAVVTGGVRGIGLAITKALLQNKVKVRYLNIYYLKHAWAAPTLTHDD